jgi:tetratricopeptide (TPR) repeat protein
MMQTLEEFYAIGNYQLTNEGIPGSTEKYYMNDRYGHSWHLKDYAGISQERITRAAIEHGFYGAGVSYYKDYVQNFSGIITNSPYRYQTITQKTQWGVFAIGPYIHYAKPYLSKEETAAEKKRLGKNLVVFPAHSALTVQIGFDLQSFINEIKRIGKDFDTIRICLFWLDINKEWTKAFIAEGFECISVGHSYDVNFLPRLRSILELADLTMSNHFSSQMAYGAYLNTPHYLWTQKLDFKARSESVFKRSTPVSDGRLTEVLKESFSHYSLEIPDEQRKLANMWAGIDKVKTPEEIRYIYDLTDLMLERKKYFNDSEPYLVQLQKILVQEGRQEEAYNLNSYVDEIYNSPKRILHPDEDLMENYRYLNLDTFDEGLRKESEEKVAKLMDESVIQKQVSDEKKQQAEQMNAQGERLFVAGKLPEALAKFREAIQLNPHYDTAYNNMGVLAFESKQYQEAFTLFQKVIELNIHHSGAIENIWEVAKAVNRPKVVTQLFKNLRDSGVDVDFIDLLTS